MLSFKEFIAEKKIITGNGAPYGQVIILTGGGGSGKGFASDKFIDSISFKTIDVDAMKNAVITLDKLGKLKRLPINPKTGKPFRHPRDLNLRVPSDVFELHQIVLHLGVKDKTLKMLLSNKGNLPNVIFDITGQDEKRVQNVIDTVTAAGYENQNINMIWVLTNYSVAVKNNAGRERVVPEDILLQTHEGTAKTMTDIMNGKNSKIVGKKGIDGDIHVILNNRENTIFYTDQDTKATAKNGKQEKGNKTFVVKSFTSLHVKKKGKPVGDGKSTKATLAKWVRDNVPNTEKTENIFKD